jgi:riboflavin biosynthesis pyrimidine reductase
MKPHVICHMLASVDGRILPSRWRPEEAHKGNVFESLHQVLGGDAWLVGRVSGQEFAKMDSYSDEMNQGFKKETWFAQREAGAYGVVLDAKGKIAWGRSEIGGDPIVTVLTERVSNAHLAGLRKDRVSYIFAGEYDLDLALALEILNRELGIKRILLEGGGVTNGAFLRAGLVDEISLAISPAVDGAKGAPCIFDSPNVASAGPAPLAAMTLQSSEVLEGGVVWLRYKLQSN